jgi:HK97 family phage portal protein
MSFIHRLGDFLLGPAETKSTATGVPVPQHSADTIEKAVREATSGDLSFKVSAVHACARVIAEGLALPPCYLHRVGPGGKTAALDHPLYRLMNAAPNERQTSYEFREQLGYHLALNSNAHVFINRSPRTGEVLELLPCDPGAVTIDVDSSRLGAPLNYTLYGVPVPLSQIWHLKGPSWLSWTGMSTLHEARSAIGLASATERYGANLFTNGARPGGLLAPAAGVALTADQVAEIKAMWKAQASGLGNAHKTILMTAGVEFTPMASNANDAQWIESRRFQIEEICRFFRVSPTKVFQSLGSQSYASVEQAHIAHDQDTDAHWHERFVQSANKALLTDKDRRAGLAISLDNRSFLRGTANERMTYYTAGIAAGIITRNEARELEGFDRSDDPQADVLSPAANLFGPSQSGSASE